MYTIEEFDRAKIKVLKYILYKKRSEHEVRTKFNKVYEEELLEDVITYLTEANYINDKDYIERTIHNFQILKNLSLREITYKLQMKGLSRNDIEEYMDAHQEELQEYEEKSAQNIVFKRQTSYEMREIKQYLLKKGYRSDSVKKAVEEEG